MSFIIISFLYDVESCLLFYFVFENRYILVGMELKIFGTGVFIQLCNNCYIVDWFRILNWMLRTIICSDVMWICWEFQTLLSYYYCVFIVRIVIGSCQSEKIRIIFGYGLDTDGYGFQLNGSDTDSYLVPP